MKTRWFVVLVWFLSLVVSANANPWRDWILQQRNGYWGYRNILPNEKAIYSNQYLKFNYSKTENLHYYIELCRSTSDFFTRLELFFHEVATYNNLNFPQEINNEHLPVVWLPYLLGGSIGDYYPDRLAAILKEALVILFDLPLNDIGHAISEFICKPVMWAISLACEHSGKDFTDETIKILEDTYNKLVNIGCDMINFDQIIKNKRTEMRQFQMGISPEYPNEINKIFTDVGTDAINSNTHWMGCTLL
ncbi:MAG: hypothetical protein LBB20_01565 [Puniceicoccales bacterium]|jgi:hypothetical protein|nr:hypothetical protein [Puniceicoccales bacterium]